MRVKYLPVKYYPAVENLPNFHKSGSVKGMKRLYYGRDALLVKCGNWIYNVSAMQDIYYDFAY